MELPVRVAGWKSAPALAAGNAMIFKPSENTPLSPSPSPKSTRKRAARRPFQCAAGLWRCRLANRRSSLVAKVSLTGSVPTGKRVLAQAGSHMKHATMELGGKSPLIMFDDADMENAVGGALLGNFYSTGQVCSNGTRVFVQGGIKDQFLDRLTTRTKAIRLGDPLDPEIHLGPLVNASQRDKVVSYIEKGKAEGATLHFGGGVPQMQGSRGRLFRRADDLHQCHR